jgi:hypothetical protein
LSGSVAVVGSRWQGQGTYRSEAFNDDQRCGQTWLRTPDVWQLLSEHCVQIVLAAGPHQQAHAADEGDERCPRDAPLD